MDPRNGVGTLADVLGLAWKGELSQLFKAKPSTWFVDVTFPDSSVSLLVDTEAQEDITIGFSGLLCFMAWRRCVQT
ncbi:hypothetical protein Q8A67_004352 [Cirrhinus molitorella]|uniref:Uncharacterized protein n=1 Tax=Cirrhinus molitorella TaxID=172907 RepID=A0AA88Q571_9TELE|nr:hypothetical protein Q8A67_004352 [Cirrhinus molitorella]